MKTFLSRIAIEAARDGRARRRLSPMLSEARKMGLAVVARGEISFDFGPRKTHRVWATPVGAKYLHPDAEATFRLGAQEEIPDAY
jgi:hypothetical protein